METITALTKRILIATVTIQEEFPELTTYLDEMPVKFPENRSTVIDQKYLNDYCNTLDELLKSYANTH